MNPITDANKKEFGEKLRKMREEKGFTQADVAKAAGINTNYYACIERGEINTTYDKIQSIVKALNVKSSDILPF
jgi:transcriptional regulator with XRE-family HTH domain